MENSPQRQNSGCVLASVIECMQTEYVIIFVREVVFFFVLFFYHGASGTQICSSSSDSWSNLPETSSLHYFLLIQHKCSYLQRYRVVCLFACLISYQSVICMSYTIYIDAVVFSSSSSALQGFPNEPAADIALNTVKRWIKENPDKVGQVWVMQI